MNIMFIVVMKINKHVKFNDFLNMTLCHNY